MEESILYELMENGLLRKWREAAEQAERETYFFTNEREALHELEAGLDEKNRKLLAL